MSWKPGVWITTAIMVGLWGYILILGVTDPLGGINTFFPLFGISNQLLAAIALAIVMAIVAKKQRFKHIWVVVLPLAFATVITMYASLLKIFSPNPSVGYWANHFKFKEALAAGETSLGTAGNVEAMNAVVRNTFVQGSLSILFMVLAIIVIAASTVVTFKAYRHGKVVDPFETEEVESKIYAPSGLISSKPERELEQRWKEYDQKVAAGNAPRKE